MQKKFTFISCLLSVISLLLVMAEASASANYKLRDYAQAMHTNDVQKILVLRSYMLGAVETHLLYAKMLRDFTNVNILCPGNNALNMDELGAILELKIMTLRRRYGEDIMDMPITKVVQMIVEEQYKCF